MNTSVVYKYRSLYGIIKYEVLEGEFGVDNTLHLRDTSCSHYGDKCQIEVVMNEDGKSYRFSKALNDNAKRYEYFHTMEMYWNNKKDAFVEGLEISINSYRKSIEGYESEMAKTNKLLEDLQEKEVRYLTAEQVKIGKMYHVSNQGMCRIIGSILFEDGSKGYLTDDNYDTRYDDGDGDRIILIEKNGKIISENNESVFLTTGDYENLKDNNEIVRLKKIVDRTTKNIANAIRRIEHYHNLISKKDTLTVEAMIEMRNNI